MACSGGSGGNPPGGGGGNSATGSGGQLGGSGGAGTSTSSPPETGIPSGTGGTTSPIVVPCTSDATTSDFQSPASGTFSGSDVDGYICKGGAFAYMERTQASSYVGSQLLVIIDSALTGTSTSYLQFNRPADATGGGFSIMAGVGSAVPGTYRSNGTSCGSLAFCIYLPLPPDVQCPDDAGVCSSPYCSMQGPISALRCQPQAPEACYVAKAADSCLPDSQSPVGSWTLTLTEVTPYAMDAGSTSMSYYVVHGRFTATMVEDQGTADAGTITADLAIDF